MSARQVNLPLAIVISLVTAVGGAALGAGVVRSDVGHLSSRMERVETDVEAVSAEITELKVVHTGDSARDAEWRLAVERRLGAIETSLTSSADTLQELRTLLRRRRR